MKKIDVTCKQSRFSSFASGSCVFLLVFMAFGHHGLYEYFCIRNGLVKIIDFAIVLFVIFGIFNNPTDPYDY